MLCSHGRCWKDALAQDASLNVTRKATLETTMDVATTIEVLNAIELNTLRHIHIRFPEQMVHCTGALPMRDESIES